MTNNEPQDNASKASLGQMPAELKHAIFKELEKDDHMALCTVSKAVHPSATTFLYEEFNNHEDQSFLSTSTAQYRSQLSQLIRTLTKKPELAQCLKRLYVHKIYYKELLTEEEVQYCSQVLATCFRTQTASSDTQPNREKAGLLQFLDRGLRAGDSRAMIAVLILAAKKVEQISINVRWLTDSPNRVDTSEERELDVIVRILIGLRPGDGVGRFEKLPSVRFHVLRGSGRAEELWQNAQSICRMHAVEHLSLVVPVRRQKDFATRSIQPSEFLQSLFLNASVADGAYLKCALRLSRGLKNFAMLWAGVQHPNPSPSEVTLALSAHKHSLTSLKLTALSSYLATCFPITSLRKFAHLKSLTIDTYFLTTGFSKDDLWIDPFNLEYSLTNLLPLGLENLILCTQKHLFNFVEIFGSSVFTMPQILKTFKVQFDVDKRLKESLGQNVSTLAMISQAHGSSITTTHFDLEINVKAHTIIIDLRDCAVTLRWIKSHGVGEISPNYAELDVKSLKDQKYHASPRVRAYIESSEIKEELDEFWDHVLSLKLPRFKEFRLGEF